MSSGSCVAVDVGGTTTRVALVESGSIARRFEEPTARSRLAEQIAALVRRLEAENLPIGVAVPGPVSRDGRAVAFTGNVGLRNYPLVTLLEDELGVAVTIDDDANCAALGEAATGAALGAPSSVTIVVGTGIGAGIVIAGSIHRGANRTAGELGHIRLDPGGPACSCGRTGCFEAVANGAALMGRFDGAPDAVSVFASARRGDPAAIAAVEVTANWIAAGVAAIASIVDPTCVVLAGGVGRQPEVVTIVQSLAPSLCIEPIGDQLDIRPAALGDDAGLIGAGLLFGSGGGS